MTAHKIIHQVRFNDQQQNQGSHFRRYLRREACCFCEHVEVSACEGECDWLLHLDGNSFLLLVHVGGLGQLDVAHPNVSGGGELDSLLGAGDDHGLTELGQVFDHSLELSRRHLDHRSVIWKQKVG